MAVTQQKLYIDNALMMAIINLVNAIVVAVCFSFMAPHWGMLCWLGIVFTFTLVGLRSWRLSRGVATPSTSSGNFLKKAEVSSLVLGAVWGMPNFYAGSVNQEVALFFLLVSSGMASGYTSMVSACPRMALRFVLGISVPSFFAAVFYLGSFGLAVAALIIVLNLSLAQQAIRSFKQLESLVASRNEAQTARAHLLDAVESIEDAFAIFGEDGDVLMANSRHRQWFANGFDVTAATNGKVVRMSEQTWAMCAVLPLEDGRIVCIHKDVSRLKVRESELIAARRESDDANAAKARFMSTMSHELRTPLNIINGFSKIMSSSSRVIVTASEMREYSDSILDAGEHLLTVINDIIEFSQVGSDRYMHDPAPEDIRDLLSKAISLSAKFQGITDLSGLDVSVSKNMGELVVDEAAFRRVLISLLSNAFKFGGPSSRIVVRAFVRDDGCPVVTIRDFGVGINQDELERVFEPFYQGELARSGQFSGTGLGLALARELMRLHGGRVELHSRPSVGTTASVLLPASAHIPLKEEPKQIESKAAPVRPIRAVA
ncbi:MAG: HAMP domain-containing sensor histidine kinase [Pseudomonadota bacterium]